MAKKNGTLSKEAALRIYRLLIDGELQPGAAISQRSIASRLGMSTQPIALAFKQLEADGIIVSKLRSGTRVATYSPLEAWDALQLRLAVEEKAISIVCANASDQDIDDLTEFAREADRVYDDELILEYDNRFHLALCRMSKSASLTGYMEKNLAVFRVKQMLCPGISFLNRLLAPVGKAGDPAPQRGHVRLLELIKMRKSEEARKLLIDHVIGYICVNEGLYGADYREWVREIWQQKRDGNSSEATSNSTGFLTGSNNQGAPQ